jgi:hypothetical protein
MKYTAHARQRMAERGITEGDIKQAKRHPVGPPEPGALGTVVIEGVASGGRHLKVVQSTTDSDLVVSLYWVL